MKKENKKCDCVVCRSKKDLDKRCQGAKEKILVIHAMVGMLDKEPRKTRFNISLLCNELQKSLNLYSLNFGSLSILELYGFLENILIFRLKQEFKEIKISNKLNQILTKENSHPLDYFLRKKKATEIANILKKIGVISKDTFSFVQELEEIRNFIVHKNIEKIRKYNIKSKKIKSLDLDNPKEIRFNVEKYLLRAIKSSWEICPKEVKKIKSNSRIDKIYLSRGKTLSEILNDKKLEKAYEIADKFLEKLEQN